MSALQAFDDEPIPDSIPLTARERVRKAELESVVEAGFETFLRVGAALRELRDGRYYRTTHATFAEYCRERFNLARSSVDQLIRSSTVARDLLDSGEELSPRTTEAVIRPLSALPTPELKAATWSLVKSLAPESEPRQPLVSKVCRMVRNCLEDCGQNGQDDDPSDRSRAGYHRRKRTLPDREMPFARPVLRLARWHGFSPEVVVAHIEKLENATTLFAACNAMITRLRQVQERLISRFPNVEHNQE
jgi:hypothetical protein